MGYLFDLEGPIAQGNGYDREDGSTTCRANRDTLFWNVAENFTTQQHNYYLKNNTYDGLVFKHEVIDITPEGEIQIFINILGVGSERKRQILNYSTNYLGKLCCEQQFSQFILPQIEKLSVDMTGKSYFNLPSGTKAFWDDNTQTCRIKPVAPPTDSCATTFKIVLNPKGNDGNIFNVGANDTDCTLNIEFDYLFKLDCAKLQQLMVNSFDPQSDSTSEINLLKQEIATQEVKCETLRQEITTLTTDFSNTSYSVTCENFNSYITPQTNNISPLSFDVTFTCVNEGVGKKGYRYVVNNIKGGTPPYKYNGIPSRTKEESIIGKVFEVTIPNNTLNVFDYPLVNGTSATGGAQGEPNFDYMLSQIAWFTVTDSKGLSLSKSITLNCPLNTETETETTTTTNGGTTGGGTTTTTTTGSGRGGYYPNREDGEYVPSPYLPDWGQIPTWYSDPNTSTTTYNYADKPYRNPITPVRVVSNNFNNTGFGDISSTTPFAFYQYGKTASSNASRTESNTGSKTFCISEPNGLTEWQKILGPVNYEKFTRGDSTSYTCQQVATLYKLQETNSQVYLTECTTAFTTKARIKQQIDTKIKQQADCNSQLELLNAQLAALLAQQTTNVTSTCKTITDVLETLDVSFTLDVVESDGSLTTVYEFPLFPTIGTGNLYEYLLEKQNDSGFYICGKPDEDELVWAEKDECVPLIFEKYNLYGPSTPLGFYMFECEGKTTPDGDLCNVSSCRFTRDMLLKSLYNQSGYERAQIETFKGSLSQKIMSSNWLNYSEVIDDENILELIKNKKIKISLKVNNICSDICVMLDNIKLNKECVNGTEGFVTLTKSPGFDLTRIIDNKKSWNSNTSYVNREFVISNPTGGTSIRTTDYDVLDERLVINTKEIDLNINIASAIENDVQCFINDNTDILNSVTEIDCGCSLTECFEDVFEIIPYAEAVNSGLIPYQLDPYDFVTKGQAVRDAWLKAWNQLMLATGPYLDIANGVPHPDPSPLTMGTYEATRTAWRKALHEFNLASGGGFIEGLTIDEELTPSERDDYTRKTFSNKELLAPQMFNTKCGRIYKRIGNDGYVYFVETPNKELKLYLASNEIAPRNKVWIDITSLVQEDYPANWDFGPNTQEKAQYFCKWAIPNNYTTWTQMMSFHYQTNNNTSHDQWVNPVEDTFFIDWDTSKGKCMTNMFKQVVPEHFSMFYPITSLNFWENYGYDALGQTPQCCLDIYLRNSGSTACTAYDFSWPDTAGDIDTLYRSYRDYTLKLQNETKLSENGPLFQIYIIDPATNMVPDESGGIIPVRVTTTIRKGSHDGNIVFKEQYVLNDPLSTCTLFDPSGPKGLTSLTAIIGITDPNSAYWDPLSEPWNFFADCPTSEYVTLLSGSTSGLPLAGASNNGVDRNWRFDEDYYVHFDVVNNNTDYVYEVTNNDFNLKDRPLHIVCPTSASTQTFNINAALNSINTHKTKMLNNIQDDLDWALDNCSCDLPEPPMFTDAMRLDFMDDLTRMPSFENIVAIPYTSGTVDYSSSATLYGKSNEYYEEFYYFDYYSPIEASIADLEYDIATGMTMGFPIEAYPTLNYSGLTEPNVDPDKMGNYVKGKVKKLANLWWKKAYTYSAWTATTYVTHSKTLAEIFPNVQDFKYLRAQTNPSDLPIKGNAGDLIVIGNFSSPTCSGCGAPSTFVGYAWDPILESWSTGLYNFIETTILNTRTAQRYAKLFAKRELLKATKPLLWANEYFIAHGIKQWMYGDAKNFVPSNRKGSDVIYNYNNGLPLGLPPTYVVTATTHTIPSYTGNSDNIIY